MTDEALAKFRASKGWTVGADASVTLVNVGANAPVDSKTAQQAIVGYVLTNGGLMANVSLEGTKITPLTHLMRSVGPAAAPAGRRLFPSLSEGVSGILWQDGGFRSCEPPSRRVPVWYRGVVFSTRKEPQ